MIRGLVTFYAVVLVVQWFTAKDHQGFWPMLGLGLLLWFVAVRDTNKRADTTLGSASFGSSADLRKLATNDGDLLIGRGPNGQLLRYDGPAHLLTIAPTRSGPSVAPRPATTLWTASRRPASTWPKMP